MSLKGRTNGAADADDLAHRLCRRGGMHFMFDLQCLGAASKCANERTQHDALGGGNAINRAIALPRS
jgi:hypothetical protein